MKIIVQVTKLFFDGLDKESPKGTTSQFNILDNYQFKKDYGYMNPNKFFEYASDLVDKWNRTSNGFWAYDIVEWEGV